MDGSVSCADMQTTQTPAALDSCVSAHLQWMTVQNYAARSIEERRKIHGYFTSACHSTGIGEVNGVDCGNIEAWQAYLCVHQKKGGGLSIGVQHNRLVQLQAFFSWLVKKHYSRSKPSARRSSSTEAWRTAYGEESSRIKTEMTGTNDTPGAVRFGTKQRQLQRVHGLT